MEELICHLLRLMDLFDASRDKLPLLTQVDVNCEVVLGPLYDWEESRPYDWVKVRCVLEDDQLFGWFTRNDSWGGWTPPKDQ